MRSGRQLLHEEPVPLPQTQKPSSSPQYRFPRSTDRIDLEEESDVRCSASPSPSGCGRHLPRDHPAREQKAQEIERSKDAPQFGLPHLNPVYQQRTG